MTAYTLKFLSDDRDSWTESALESFRRVQVFHFTSEITIKQICNKIAKSIVQCEHNKYSHKEDDITKCAECKCSNRILYDESDSDEKITIGSSNFRNFLLENHKMCIYQQHTGKYWKRIYIGITECEKAYLAIPLDKGELSKLFCEVIEDCCY
jgi:hypothetical protein